MAVVLSIPVLVVDDYNTMVRIIRNLLLQLGFRDVDDASDGSAAIAKMRTRRYGLVISDWNMTPMTGYELLKEVRADPSFATTPFIMITAESKTENVIAAKRAGVDNYIVKPFNAQTLQNKVQSVFPDDAPPPRAAWDNDGSRAVLTWRARSGLRPESSPRRCFGNSRLAGRRLRSNNLSVAPHAGIPQGDCDPVDIAALLDMRGVGARHRAV